MLNGLPWKWTEIILSFLKLHPSTAFRTLVDYEGYSISSKGFLPTVVDIMVIWIKFTHSHPFYFFFNFFFFIPINFSSLIPNMLMFTLIICLTMSNSPWFLDLMFQVPMQYFSLQHRILLSSPDTSTTECCSDMTQPLHSFWSYSSCPLLFLGNILETFWPGGLIFLCHNFLPFYTVYLVLTSSM